MWFEKSGTITAGIYVIAKAINAITQMIIYPIDC